jgi:caa(3)-type oxidase subunit IV
MSDPYVGSSISQATDIPGREAPAHGPNFQAYMYVFYALCVLTLTSFLANLILSQMLHLPHLSLLVIMAVSIAKATLVAMIFMHLKFDGPKLYCIIIPVCVMGVMMMIVLMPDIVFSWHHYFYLDK